MNKRLIRAAFVGLLVGAASRSKADVLYDACHKALATGGTVVLSDDGKTFTYTTCDKSVTRTYNLDTYSFERGKVCLKQENPKVSCKAEHSCKPFDDPPDAKTYTPSCVGKPKKSQ
jgi:hypothetical protein